MIYTSKHQLRLATLAVMKISFTIDGEFWMVKIDLIMGQNEIIFR